MHRSRETASLWVIGLAPADRLLKPMHKLRVVGGDRVDFLLLSAPAAPVFSLACKDDVGVMLVGELVLNSPDRWSSGRLLRGWRRLASRWRQHQSLAFGDSREPMTLPSRVVGRLRAAVELAGGIKGLLVGESRLPSRPAALLLLGRGPPFGLFVFDCGTCQLVEGGIGALRLWLL